MEIKFYGAFVLNSRVDLHAIDATPARWCGGVGSSPLDGTRTAASSCTRHTGFYTGEDSGGYHSSGKLGRYNAHRSGVIYEHDEALPALVAGVDFVERVEAWRGAVTALARDVLGAVAARRGAPAHMFAAGGAFDARAAGRFHVKRTHAGAARVLLPAHRDPSTLSLIVHFSAPPSGLELCGNQIFTARAC